MKFLNVVFLLVLALTGLNHPLHGQTISQSVIGSGGSIDRQLSFTLGETVVVTGQADGLILLQGFHQPFTVLITSIEDPAISKQVTLFPNPTDGMVTLRMESTGRFTFQVELMNLDGKRLAPMRVWEVSESAEMTADLGAFPEGIYLINLRDREGVLLEVIKVIKAQ